MATMLIQHQVQDFDTWKQVFDSSEDFRKSGGELSANVYRGNDNHNYVAALFTWDSLDNARNFTQSAKLKDAMQRAGVIGQPMITFLDEV